MTDFLSLGADDRRAIYTTIGAQIGKSAQVLEKDVWVCWALDALFTTPDRVTMAFKGGTSLSKIYDAIARFSEDVDVTLDHRELRSDLDPFPSEGLSAKQRNAQKEALMSAVKGHVSTVIKPHLEQRLAEVLPGGEGDLIRGGGADELRDSAAS